jgi:hypothetical protein
LGGAARSYCSSENRYGKKREVSPMTVFLNIANKFEVARIANTRVQSLLTTLRSAPATEQRSEIIARNVSDWQAMFPRTATSAAVEAFMRALNLESGRGNGGVEVVECMRFIDRLGTGRKYQADARPH